MAVIGQALTAPESGWKRYDDSDANISYIGTWIKQTNQHFSYTEGFSVQFQFTGTKIRAIGSTAPSSNQFANSGLRLIVDGVSKTFSNIGSVATSSVLLVEVTGLNDAIHTVQIEGGADSKGFWFDAVDIDENGEFGTTINKSFILSGDGYKKLDEGSSEKYSENKIPNMTSNTSPRGVSSASTESSPSWNAFNDSNTFWRTDMGVLVGWLSYEFSTPKTICKYSIKSFLSNNTRMPSDWTFEGSNDNFQTSVILDARIGVSNWGVSENRDFYFENPSSFKEYRVNITKNNGDTAYLFLTKLEMFEVSPATPPSWRAVSLTLPTLAQFQSEGMDDLSIFDRKVQQVLDSPQAMTDSELGEGKVFKGTVDLKKYFDLRKLEVK